MVAGAKSIQNTQTNVAVPYVDSGMTLRHCVKSTGVVPPTVLRFAIMYSADTVSRLQNFHRRFLI